MSPKTREIECPDCLRKRLRVFRVEKAGLRTYIIADPLQNRTYELEPWQFFVLEVLTECESFSRLSSAVEDRYGQPITQEDVDRLLILIAEKNMFSISAQSAPILADFNRRRALLAKSTESGDSPKPGNAADIGERALPSEVLHALGLNRQKSTKGRPLFDPTRFLKVLHPLLAPFRYTVYLIPLLLIPALVLAFRYHSLFSDDLLRWFGRIPFVWHAVVGLLTVNLLATSITALIAYNYGVTVSAFCVVFYFVVWPRFMVRVGSIDKLPRRAQAWYYAAPLLVRLTVFSVSVLIWFNTRQMEGVLPRFCLALTVITQFSFLLTVIPLRESNGYRLLSTLLDSPRLREKATNAFFNKLRGKPNADGDSSGLVVYALASALYLIAVVAVFFFLLGHALESRLGTGGGVLALVVIATVLGFRVASKIKKVSIANARASRFTAWRKRETHGAD